jgi:heme/copper-type cytochrome/quinol oxidase subunit 1
MNGKRGSAIFLKVIIFLVGIAVLTLCIYWIPVLTIRDVKVHPGGDYSLYPLLVCAYGICITFSFTLFHVYKLLTFIERNNAFSESSLKSLKVIKKCAFTAIFFIVLMIISLKVISSISGDDSAGPISVSLMSILATSIIIAVVDVLQKPLKGFLDKK